MICHNDFAPHNLVFVDSLPVAIIDFDFASPGPRIWDLARLAYRMVPLSTQGSDGFDDAARRHRVTDLLSAYGADIDPADLFHWVGLRLDHLAEFTTQLAEARRSSDLAEDAALYRADAVYVRQTFLT